MDCIHGMPPDWCAICNGFDNSEAEQAKEDKSIIDNFSNWSK